MLSFAYLSIDTDLASPSEVSPRLRDLITGLRSGDIVAASILNQLDSNLSDEIRALVAHRGMNTERFLANVLTAFALDVADETWRRVIRRDESVDNNGEAGVLTDLLSAAMHQMLLQRQRLAGETADEDPLATPGRRFGRNT
jgi:hypothetical protein